LIRGSLGDMRKLTSKERKKKPKRLAENKALPPGVALTQSGRFKVYVRFAQGSRYFGTYDSIEEAAQAVERGKRERSQLKTEKT